MKVDELEIEAIDIPIRARKDLGDIEALAKSIDALGLMQPIVVTRDMQLIAGERRLRAFEFMGRNTIPAHIVEGVVDALMLIRGEYDENTCRKDFTKTEASTLAREIVAMAAGEANARKVSNLKSGTTKPREEKITSREITGKTIDKVAAAFGMSGPTLNKAMKVTAATEDASLPPAKRQLAAEIAAEMDRTNKVDPALRRVQAEVYAPEQTEADLDPNGIEIPVRLGGVFGEGAEEFEAALTLHRQLILKLGAIGKTPAGRYLQDDHGEWKQAADRLRAAILSNRPLCVCPECFADADPAAECQLCGDRGYITDPVWNRVSQATKDKLRARAEGVPA